MTSPTTLVVDSLDALDRWEQPWRELADRVHARPFQRFGWHAAWLSTLGRASGYRPRVALLCHGSRLVGLLPLAQRVQHGLRILEWSGHGATDYNDALLDPDIDPSSALSTLTRAAFARGGDVARLTHVPPDSPCDRFLASRSVHIVAGETTWVVSLPRAGGKAWLASRSAKLRANYNRSLRKLAESGVTFHVWSPPEPIAPFLDVLLAQKRAWFAEAGVSTFFDKPAGPAFIHAAAEKLAAEGALHLAALRTADGRLVACTLNLLGRGTLYGYTVSRDPAWNRFSPGQALIVRLIEWCCDHGIERVDLLGGDQELKLRLGCQPVSLRNHMVPCSVVGRGVLGAWRLAKAAGVRRQPSA